MVISLGTGAITQLAVAAAFVDPVGHGWEAKLKPFDLSDTLLG